ncbi:hypothetical protein AXG93_2752s2380 [Marchantia polymorpha subsp. ruderalis]|uniref:Uncharacterized protein n=1 Tax=Marchantia polymorpha subsp. ruderalis TaxID=1480154 RepID=A0A176VV25_MARPO|nr:hypothetical protein AXG93_2752s2380 [Marchantia polymorpha subsp. ruderalis]
MASRDLARKASNCFATRRRLRRSPDIKAAARISNSRKENQYRIRRNFDSRPIPHQFDVGTPMAGITILRRLAIKKSSTISWNPRDPVLTELGRVASATATAAPLPAKIFNAVEIWLPAGPLLLPDLLPPKALVPKATLPKAHVSPPSSLRPWPIPQVGSALKASDPKSSKPKALEPKAHPDCNNPLKAKTAI